MTAVQARGRAYENRAVRTLRKYGTKASVPEGTHGQWLDFTDLNGPGCAQPDYYITLRTKLLVFEFKYSRTRIAERQLCGLYGPLLFDLYHLPLVLVSCFYNSGPGYKAFPKSPYSLEDCIGLPDFTFNEWHFLT